MNVVTRIPPSPTGRLHIGTARTALFNYLFAKHHGGNVVFRSEDTDKARSKSEYEEEIIQGLNWLGIFWDEFSRQSERSLRYRELLERIVAEGKAYVSREPGKDDPSKTVEIVRLKNPGKSVTFTDLVRGDITFDTKELGDLVIARSLGDALYHFAVVVDDMDSGVTHVIRGEDHISNTPRQILIQEALGATRPAYVHLPLIVDERRAKLSKRSGATSVIDYKDEGFLPEGLINYLALLGWNPGDDREDFSLEQLVAEFSLDGVQKSGAMWNREKLLSVNQRWMRKLSDEDFAQELTLPSGVGDTLPKVIPLLKERARTFREANELLTGELSCLFAPPELHRHTLAAKELPNRPIAEVSLKDVMEAVKTLPEGASSEEVKGLIMPLADAQEALGKGGRGAVLWPLRYALSGLERSPDPFTLISILGPTESLSRIRHAVAILEG